MMGEEARPGVYLGCGGRGYIRWEIGESGLPFYANAAGEVEEAPSSPLIEYAKCDG